MKSIKLNGVGLVAAMRNHPFFRQTSSKPLAMLRKKIWTGAIPRLGFCVVILSTLLCCSAARADVIASEGDGDFSAVDFVSAGWAVTLSGGINPDASNGSNDGFFGPDNAIDGVAGAPTGGGSRRTKRGSANTSLTLTNNTGSAVELATLLFDAGLDARNMRFDVSYIGGGGLGPDTFLLGTTGDVPVTGTGGVITDYADYSFAFSDFVGPGMFTTTSLADSDSATFELDPDGTNNILFLDNIAITSATAVPEPHSIAIWGLLSLVLSGFGVHRMRRAKK